jgi:excisionase family DNA binding protein
MTSGQLLTDGEAADLVRMLRPRLVRLAKARLIPFVRLPDGELRFEREELVRWIESHRRATTEDSENGPDSSRPAREGGGRPC